MELPTVHHHLIDRLAVLNAIIGSVALYPQLFELITRRLTAESLSLTSFLLIALNSIVWLWYGIHRKNIPLIISSTMNAVASIGILVLVYY